MSKQVLVREIDGHKFFSNVYATKLEATQSSKEGFSPLFESMKGGWMNGSFAGFSNSYQEDSHVAP